MATSGNARVDPGGIPCRETVPPRSGVSIAKMAVNGI